MKLDVNVDMPIARAGAHCRELEAAGVDGVLTTETGHDPFLPLLAAASATQRIDLMTGIAVAFARSPMTVASTAHDLNALSGGRFVLGLGSQIRPHITKRYSMPWSKPAARMREYIEALHAIWDCWYDGNSLHFRGEFYRHTLMTPFFTPTDTEHGRPRVMLAAVGPLMTRVAGEVANGLLCHAFSTPAYLREVTMPAVEAGLAASERDRSAIEVTCAPFVITGRTAEEYAASERLVREQIAFYGSTPAYRRVLDLHGWGELQTELNALSKRGEWKAMGELVTGEMLDQFAIRGENADELASAMLDRYSGTADRIVPGYLDSAIALELGLPQALNA